MRLRAASAALLATGLGLGSWADRAATSLPLEVGPYLVAQGDFHVHSFLGDGVISPFNVVLEARRRGLHVLAITNHNQVFAARLAQRFSRAVDGPLVLVGEEITAPGWHLIAAGIERAVSWRQPLVEAIDEIHAQGGVAIAAHPTEAFWPAYTDEALGRLDGAERMHPLVYVLQEERAALIEFFERARRIDPTTAAIGSSDFHALDALGLCRTFLFVTALDEEGVLDAIREGRTVVLDEAGEPHGDPRMLELLSRQGVDLARDAAAGRRAAGPLPSAGRACGLLGLLGLVALGGPARPRRRSAVA